MTFICTEKIEYFMLFTVFINFTNIIGIKQNLVNMITYLFYNHFPARVLKIYYEYLK